MSKNDRMIGYALNWKKFLKTYILKGVKSLLFIG